jgi:hypothetical protein
MSLRLIGKSTGSPGRPRRAAPRRRIGQHQNKRDNPFSCRFAPEEHHLVLRCRQLMRRHDEKPLLQVGHFVEESLELPAWEAAELGWR